MKKIWMKCDVCGKEYETGDSISDLEIQEFLTLRFRGGYHSVFGDESEVKCDICQHCLKKLLGEYLTIGDDSPG